MTLVRSERWGVEQENADYHDYDAYTRDDNPGIYVKVRLTFEPKGHLAWATVEQGRFGGMFNVPTESRDVELEWGEAQALLLDENGPETLVARSGMVVPEGDARVAV
jgi:hypothetical protein